MISAPPLRNATPWFLCDPSGSPESPVTRAAAALVHDLPPHAWVRCVFDGTSRVLRWSILSMTMTTTVLTIALPSQYVSTPPPQPPFPTLLQQLPFQRDATSTSLFIALPPLNPAQMRVLRQDEANVQSVCSPVDRCLRRGARTFARPPPIASAPHASQP